MQREPTLSQNFTISHSSVRKQGEGINERADLDLEVEETLSKTSIKYPT